MNKKYISVLIALILLIGIVPGIALANSAGSGGNSAPARSWDNFPKELKDKYTLIDRDIKIVKKDNKGNPLKGIKFTMINEEKGTSIYDGEIITDDRGEANIEYQKIKDWGFSILKETNPKDSNNKQYKSKDIPLYIDLGIEYLGEVAGKDSSNAITYQDLIKKLDPSIGSSETISTGKVTKIGDFLELKGDDLTNNGTWIKIRDFKNNKNLLISKKPITKNVSWNDIRDVGAMYGLDKVDMKGRPKPGAKDIEENYVGKILDIGSKKYIVRLMTSEEWDRYILPITKDYRYGSGSINDLKSELKMSTPENSSEYLGDNKNYTIQLHNYNWFGDLTLGAHIDFQYNNKQIRGTGERGQSSWAQDFYTADNYLSWRGNSYLGDDAASSGGRRPDRRYDYYGFRPVLEELPCYDDMCFEGEVSGNDLGVTYQQIIDRANGKGTKPDSSVNPEIKALYDQELSKGGMWLKFTDYKDSVKQANNGKPYTFYVAKKPVIKNVSWYDLESLGMVYGTDTVDTNGPKSGITTKNSASDNSYGIRKSYKPTTLDGKNGKYQISLMRGRSNYGDKQGIDSSTSTPNNSQWNRSIVAITTSYRGENDRLEDDLKTKSDGTKYTGNLDNPNMNLKYKTGNYNWFGDLTLGTYEDKFQYNNKQMNSVGDQGQWNLAQDFYSSSSYRSLRGYDNLSVGAAGSYGGGPGDRYDSYGFRPVLSVVEEPPCYDEMCFEGEVSGNDLGVTYQQIIAKANGKGEKPDSSVNPEIKTLYDQELAKGGMWLKFTDYKESVKNTNNGKPYTFYVAKKPVLKNVTWYDLEELGMVYATDTVDSNGPKPGITTKNSASDDSFGIRKSYRPTTLDGKNGKYQISLMRGLSNYGDKNGINNALGWTKAPNSQWNRSIVAITTSYRGENSSMEDDLKTKSDGTKYTDDLNKPNMDLKYKTGNYNWFGDLTIGAYNNFQYNNKQMGGVNYQGQYNWAQDFCSSSSYRLDRGYDYLNGGAASSRNYPGSRNGSCGFRPVLSTSN